MDEFDQIQGHSPIRSNIMGQVRMLRKEVPALAEHHKRLDGNGNSHGLSNFTGWTRRGSCRCSLALPSNQFYREALRAADVLEIIINNRDTQLVGQCVD